MKWVLVLHNVPEDKREALLEYCERASAKDKTFRFTDLEDRIIVKCVTKDHAYRRGVLFHSRYGCFFEVYKER